MTDAELVKEATRRGILVPLPKTLEKYGLDMLLWLRILEGQGWACGVCGNMPPSGKLVTDHEHVKGWAKLPPEERRRYVRGLVCWIANHYWLGRGMDDRRAQGVVDYLKAYARRRPRG